MDLVKILENVPVDTPLYSMIDGTVYYKKIDYNSKRLIVCSDSKNCIRRFTREGKCYSDDNGECILFPSKDNRNWDDFGKNQFKPFDKVLVRDYDYDPWELAFFAYIDYDDDGQYCTINGIHWVKCIPYEGNEHLLGTTKYI